MKTLTLVALAACAYLVPSPLLRQEPEDTESTAEAELAGAVEEFSATTRKGGPGWEAYADFLHPDFTRWTLAEGSSLMNREDLVEGLKQWWEQGSCVGQSEVELVSQRLEGDLGLVRRRVSETYLGPDGKLQGSSRNLVTQVWLREGEAWSLWAMEVAPLASEGR